MNELCEICGRPLGTVDVQRHHLIPKTFKGKVTVDLHKICHQKIHATFSERELYNYYHTVDRILEHDQMQRFVKWVQNKPAEFYLKNTDTKDRRKQRR